MPQLTALEAVILALAVYRVTLLVVADELTAPPRDWAILRLNERKHGPAPNLFSEGYSGPTGPQAWRLDFETWQQAAAAEPHRLAFLLSCPWCASPYVAAVLVGWALYGDPGRLSWAILSVLAASAAAGYLASKASP